MPSSLRTSFTVGATGTSYTAPADGWFVVIFNFTSNTDNYVQVNTSAGLNFQEHNDTPGSFSFFIPVARKQTIDLIYQGTIKSKSLTFIYANGAK